MALGLLVLAAGAHGDATSPDPPEPTHAGTAAPADSGGQSALPPIAPPSRPRDLVGPAEPGDSLRGLPIARVEIEPRNIFDPVPKSRLAPVFRLANRLHIRTRHSTVREQLLFAEGQRWSPELGRESERNLRALDFLAPAELAARRESDSVVVRVVTRDVWSTQPQFDLQSADGRQFGSFAFTERNLLGFGKSFDVAIRELPTGRSRELAYDDPNVAGSHVQLRYSASTGGGAVTNAVSLEQPFYAEETPRVFGFGWRREASTFPVYEGGAEVASFDRRLETARITWGVGALRDGWVRRLTLTGESIDRRFGPTTATTMVPPEFLGGEESLRLRRLRVDGRLWHPEFIERTRVNGFGLVEDFDVGTSMNLGLGFAPKALGSFQDEGYGEAGFDTGVNTPVGFGLVSSSVSTRIQTLALETVGRVDARWVQQSRFGQTLVLAAHGVSGHDASRDFEAVVGGLNGLRAFPVDAVAGRRLWRFNAENRWTVGHHYWENLTVGAVVFGDAARAWGPGSAGSQWFVDAGTGLRAALPQWSLGQVMRIDLAWPIQPTRGGRRNPVLSFGSSQAF